MPLTHVTTRQRLEGDAHALPVAVEHRPAAVAAVDSCVDLHRQQVYAAVAVVRHLQAPAGAPHMVSTPTNMHHGQR